MTAATTAASKGPAPPLISTLSAIRQLHQFDQGTGEIGRVHECDPPAPTSLAGSLVDQPGTLGLQVGEGFLYVGNRVGDVVEAFTAFGEETPDRRVDRKSTRLNSSHVKISYAVFCLKKKKNIDK